MELFAKYVLISVKSFIIMMVLNTSLLALNVLDVDSTTVSSSFTETLSTIVGLLYLLTSVFLIKEDK